jgi:four helix bundle protein
MAVWKSFEDMDAWKEGCRLVLDVYEVTGSGPFARDFKFQGQIRDAAISVPSNIAEGFERGTKRYFIQFLRYSKGSCGELRTQVYLACKLKYITAKQMNELVAKARKVAGMIGGLINYLEGEPD